MLETPLFGAGLTILAFIAGVVLQRKLRVSVLNPLVTATALVVAVLLIFQIPYETYAVGGEYVAFFLTPATVCLAIPIYRQLDTLKKNLLPILVGCAVGGASAIGCVVLLTDLFGLEESLALSLVPKSITMPFGMSVSESIGGIPSITVIAITVTGIFGAVLAPLMIRIFRVDNPVAAGLAIGCSSHALGTTRALQLGETEGAMSGLAVSITGLFTVLYSVLFF